MVWIKSFEAEAPASFVLAAGALAVAGLLALLWRRPEQRGTTLMAPWYWSVICLLAITASEILIAVTAGAPQSWVQPLRFAAAVTSFCPTMSLLGAKRPQDRAWQFIVLSLWVILILPAVHWLLWGGVRELHPAVGAFVSILTLVGLANGLGTRLWGASLLFCLGQVALLSSFFTWAASDVSAATLALAGTACLVASWWIVALGIPPARPVSQPLDRVWLDFRDSFGLVWSLRVAERINTSATMSDWPVWLAWGGFRVRGSRESASLVPAAVDESLRTLLRRFVSPEWIDARLGADTVLGGAAVREDTGGQKASADDADTRR